MKDTRIKLFVDKLNEKIIKIKNHCSSVVFKAITLGYVGSLKYTIKVYVYSHGGWRRSIFNMSFSSKKEINKALQIGTVMVKLTGVNVIKE